MRAIATRDDARNSWEECKAIHGRIFVLTISSQGPGVFAADIAHNLTLIQAYAALGVALLFKLSMPLDSLTGLKTLIKNCKNKLVHLKQPTLIEEGRLRRNGVAHHAKWLKRAEVFEYAEAIQDELIAMGILDESELYQFYQRR